VEVFCYTIIPILNYYFSKSKIPDITFYYSVMPILLTSFAMKIITLNTSSL